MNYQEFIEKHQDPCWALMFCDLGSSLKRIFSRNEYRLYCGAQLTLCLIGIIILSLMANIHGFGLLVGLPLVIYSAYSGRLNISLLDLILQLIIVAIFSFSAHLLGVTTGKMWIAAAPCLVFVLVGILKAFSMYLMERRMAANEELFEDIYETEKIVWQRIIDTPQRPR